MEKRLENMSPVKQEDLVNNEVYSSQINADKNSWKWMRICSLASLAGIATAAFISSKIVYHPECISLSYIKGCFGL